MSSRRTRQARKLARRCWGVGKRRVLLLHGSTSSSATWWRIGPELAELGWSVTALDLPSHGASPRLNEALTPHAAAAAVAATVPGERFDLLGGHSFGAATALALATEQPRFADRLVLEELPGPNSVDWEAEARSVRQGAATARRDPAAVYADLRNDQPRWNASDCEQAVHDLASCAEEDVAAGLERGRTWPALTTEVTLTPPTQLLLAPAATGINHLEDATALRAADRARAEAAATVVTTFHTGHCVHRDDPLAWIDSVESFAHVPRRAPSA